MKDKCHSYKLQPETQLSNVSIDPFFKDKVKLWRQLRKNNWRIKPEVLFNLEQSLKRTNVKTDN
jgi:hypothetical protein